MPACDVVVLEAKPGAHTVLVETVAMPPKDWPYQPDARQFPVFPVDLTVTA